MELQSLIYLFVGISFAVYIGIALWAKAGSTKDFYVAGGGVPPVANGMATAADWMSAASFISLAGIISFKVLMVVHFNGMDRWIRSTCYVISSLLKKVW